MAHRNGEYGYIWNLKIPSRNRFGKYTSYIYIYIHTPIIGADPTKKPKVKFQLRGQLRGFCPHQLRLPTLKECSYSPCWCGWEWRGWKIYRWGWDLTNCHVLHESHLHENFHRVFMGFFKMLGKYMFHTWSIWGWSWRVSWRIFCWLVAKKKVGT